MSMNETTEHKKAFSFREEVIAATPSNPYLERCIQCGSCGGSCPSGPDMQYTPRAIFAMIKAGMRDEVLRSNTFWYCVSCYYCMVRCPQEIHITDVMYTLKRMAVQEKLYQESDAAEAPDFSNTFIEYVERYGRSFEFGLATRHHLRHHPLDMLRKAQLGLGMLRKGRLELRPKSIRDIDQLKAILAKAKAMEAEDAQQTEAIQ